MSDQAQEISGPTTLPPGVGGTEVEAAIQPSAAEEPTAIEELPFTGPSTFLIVPGLILVATGVLALFATGVGGPAGLHVSKHQTDVRLGLRRGRHEFKS
ncbi:MAG TPA: hypothetical protein VFS66_14425 [Acidimicrobiia bacterium]|nr:hypothetical protein [Acidimicrobiia bacterium]